MPLGANQPARSGRRRRRVAVLLSLGMILGAVLAARVLTADRDPDVPVPADWSLLPEPAVVLVKDAVEQCRRTGRAGDFAALGRLYHGNAQPALAAAAYGRALALGDEDARTVYLLGLLEAEFGRTSETLRHLQAALDVEPTYPPAWYHLGRARLEGGEVDAALEALERALTLDESEAMFHVELARALREAGRLDEAEDALRAALVLRPGHPAAHQLLGLTLRQLGREREALRHLATVRRYSTDVVRDPWLLEVQRLAVTVEARLDWARAYLQAGRYDSAIRLLEQLGAAYPDRAEVFRRLGEAHARAGRMTRAEAAYRQVLQLEPHDARTRTSLAELLVMRDDLVGAERQIRRALADDPDDVGALVVAASITLRDGRAAEAAERLRSITAARGDHVGAHFWLGEALVAVADREGAVAAYERALELQPDLAAARRRLQALRRTDGTPP